MASFTQLLSGLAQSGFLFVVVLKLKICKSCLFIFSPFIFLKLIYFAPLHDCPDVAVTGVLLDHVVFQYFHWHWVFMVLGAAEVTYI